MRYEGVRRFSEDGIPYVDTTDEPDFNRHQLTTVTGQVEDGERMTITDVDQLLETHFNPDMTRLQRLARTFLPAASLLTAAVAIKSGLEIEPSLSAIGTLPPAAMDISNSLADLIPLGSSEAVGTGVLDQLPPALELLALSGGTAYAAYKTARGTDESVAQAAQRKLRTNVTAGKQWWNTQDMPGAVIAYVDSKTSLPGAVAKATADRTVVMTHQSDIEGATVLFPEDADLDRIYLALRQAGASRAAQLVVYGLKETDFSPELEDRSTFPIGVARIVGFVNRFDEFCDRDIVSAGRKPVTIIGSEQQPLLTDRADSAQDLAADSRHETLAGRIALLAADRMAPTRLVDPTEATFGAIFAQAEGRPVRLVGSPDSNCRYAPSFFAAAAARPEVDDNAPPIDVMLSTSDRMTASVLPTPGVDSIYVVRGSEQAQSIKKDLPGSSVIAMDEVLNSELAKPVSTWGNL